MEEALLSYLLADAGLAALAGTAIGWNSRPQGSALPAVVLYNITPGRDLALSGPTGLAGPRVQADCLAASYKTARQLARALIAAADSIAGTNGFQGAFLEGDRSDFEGEAPDRIHRVSLDLIVWRSPA